MLETLQNRYLSIDHHRLNCKHGTPKGYFDIQTTLIHLFVYSSECLSANIDNVFGQYF